ncbi:hypothetical protein D5086_014369 [Populus alba]|uniref:Uncharacterized protein n=1 Tax=Populus alba TaxID=43335 RepID=A0ACC4C039_POPAL
MANARSTCFLLASLVIVFTPCLAGAAQYNVLNYGAKPDGRTDSTKAFLAAWTQACGSSSRSTLYVPPGRYFLLNVQFNGPCKNNAIVVRIDGSLLAPTDYRVIGNAASWISFKNVDGVTVSGGILDGHGSGLWDCKQSGNNCPSGATTLSVSNSQNIVISGLHSLNSQMFHIVVNGCHNHAVMTNVQNPIVIDQNYCPDNKNCPGQSSGVKISGVTYQDIHGTSATQVAVEFDCSKRSPCTGIKMENVRLTYMNQPAGASCNNADGTASGFIQPSSCL